MMGAPPNFTKEDEAESARKLYQKGMERYLTALHDAKRELAIVAADGVSVGLPVDLPDVQLGDSLQDTYDQLLTYRRRRAR